MKIIDAHVHLWKTQNGLHNGKPVYAVGKGLSMFDGSPHQMLPPFMVNGENTAEILLANMDYAGVNGAVLVQEMMDGNQDEYLLSVQGQYGGRVKICSLYEEGKPFLLDKFDGIKLCSCKFHEINLLKHIEVFKAANDNEKFIAIDLADGDRQTAELQQIIDTYPNLKIAIGHFGMVTRKNWKEQIKLARNKNVYIESGGIIWLYHSEFYPYPSAVRAIQEAAEICGFQKLMWGSDYPRTMVAATYKMSYDFFLNATDISFVDKELFLYKNAREFYGFQDFCPLPKIPDMLGG